MHQTFPFHLPAPTAWYAVLFVVTLLLHLVFMSYVLAGSIMLGVAGLRGRLGRAPRPTEWSAVTTILKDWMPFALSAAITAGVAPLLFVQILYQQEFYTANLLSFHRWMAILPVLIIAFYLLYLLKAHRLEGKAALQGIVALLVMGGFLFVAWSWVENHLLSLHRDAWPAQYAAGAMLYKDSAILPRLGFWFVAAFPTACLVLAWQLRLGASGVDPPTALKAQRPVAVLAAISMVAAAVASWLVIPGSARDQPVGQSALAWIVIASVGALVAVFGWVAVAIHQRTHGLRWIFASAGTLVFWMGTLAAREAARLSILGSESLFARHQRVGTIAGLVLFLAFAVLGVGTIIWIVRSIAHARSRA